MNRLGLRRRAVRGAFIASASVISIATASPAFAQDNPAPANQTASGQADQEVVVTAQFREQRLQDTPLAITAVPAELLEQRSQDSLVDVANQAPNVTLRQQGASFGPSIGASIRGIGQFDFTRPRARRRPLYRRRLLFRPDRRAISTCSISSGSRSCAARRARSRAELGRRRDPDDYPAAGCRRRRLRPGRPMAAATGSALRGGATFTLADGLYGRISGTARQQRRLRRPDRLWLRLPGSGIADDARSPATARSAITAASAIPRSAARLRYHPESPDCRYHAVAADYTRDDRTNAAEVLVAAQTAGQHAQYRPGRSAPLDPVHLRPLLQLCAILAAGDRLGRPGRAGHSRWSRPAGDDHTTFDGWGLSRQSPTSSFPTISS